VTAVLVINVMPYNVLNPSMHQTPHESFTHPTVLGAVLAENPYIGTREVLKIVLGFLAADIASHSMRSSINRRMYVLTLAVVAWSESGRNASGMSFQPRGPPPYHQPHARTSYQCYIQGSITRNTRCVSLRYPFKSQDRRRTSI
jgi:hypothetical protein